MRADLKRRLKAGNTLIGSFVTIGSADTTEILALAGYDFLVIDTEHGAMSIETAANLIRAAEVHGVPSLVRVTEASDSTILRSLDIGAAGVQVPQVNSGRLAQQVARAAHYHPAGHRGLAMPRAAHYGSMGIDAYFQKSREETLVVAQCESADGLEQLEAVAAVPEVDVIFLGPFDLSHSLGIPGQVEDPRIKAAEKRVVEICAAHGKVAGIFAVNGEAAAERASQGFRYITIAMETMFLSAAAKAALATARAQP